MAAQDDELTPTGLLATPVAAAESSAMELTDYNIETAWTMMREAHAKQCQQFIMEHSKKTVEFLEEKLSTQNIKHELFAELDGFWSLPQGFVFDLTDRQRIQEKVLKYLMTNYKRHYLKLAKQRHKKNEVEKKREKELADAQSVFDQADTRTLVAMTKLTASSGDTSGKKGSLLEYLCQSQPGLVKEFKKGLKKPNSEKRERGRSSERTRGRSKEKVKVKVSASKSPRKSALRKTPAPSRTNSKASSHKSSRNSSKASSKSGRKGKGKGKSKGKGKRKGKGKGNKSKGGNNQSSASH